MGDGTGGVAGMEGLTGGGAAGGGAGGVAGAGIGVSGWMGGGAGRAVGVTRASGLSLQGGSFAAGTAVFPRIASTRPESANRSSGKTSERKWILTSPVRSAATLSSLSLCDLWELT